jgi:hypothetical protein
MDAELKKKIDELQMENEELRYEIKECNNHIDELETQMVKERESSSEIINFLKSYIDESYLVIDNLINVHEWSEKKREKIQKLRDNLINVQQKFIECQGNSIEKYKKAPKANKENTNALWEPYRQKFDDYIADGKTESWAKNKIGELMEKDGAWKKTSKKDSHKIITRPDRATLHRQLVKDRK